MRRPRTYLDAAGPARNIRGMSDNGRIFVVTTTGTRNGGAPGGHAR